MTAGELRERMTFESRILSDDGYGNAESSFVDQFTVWARVRARGGSERVIADRLTGVLPVVIRVRVSTNTLLITTGWRAVHDRSGTVYNITSVANMDEKRKYLDIDATSGEAA